MDLRVCVPSVTTDADGDKYRRLLPMAVGHGISTGCSDISGYASLTGDLPLSSPQKFDAKYQLEEEIGRGGFAIVHRVKAQDGSGRIYAAKVLLKEKLQQHGGNFCSGDNSGRVIRRLRDEIRALAVLQHPNVIMLFETFETAGELCLLMELAEGGELFNHIVDKGSFAEPEAQHVMRQLLGVIDYMHHHGVMHRDLKPENILLTGRDSWHIKVTDFGLATVLADVKTDGDAEFQSDSADEGEAKTSVDEISGRLRATTVCGSGYYMAPEVVYSSATEPYGPAVDVWSAGIIMYILLSGCPPWEMAPAPRSARRVPFPGSRWRCISPSAKVAVAQMLALDPIARANARVVLQGRWLHTDDLNSPTEAGGKREGDQPHVERTEGTPSNKHLSDEPAAEGQESFPEHPASESNERNRHQTSQLASDFHQTFRSFNEKRLQSRRRSELRVSSRRSSSRRSRSTRGTSISLAEYEPPTRR
mmetsp:Transcript_45296/g.75044  ORF Transcript_45296/g.75044 Transcript_45296/m.75044 type:complete len:476 (+) Transcript_45296:34-1461(+)